MAAADSRRHGGRGPRRHRRAAGAVRLSGGDEDRHRQRSAIGLPRQLHRHRPDAAAPSRFLRPDHPPAHLAQGASCRPPDHPESALRPARPWRSRRAGALIPATDRAGDTFLQTLDTIHEKAEEIRSVRGYLLHLGIGGSALGAITLVDALGATKEMGYGCPAEIHVPDNVDPDWIGKILDGLDLSRTYVNVVSKSGGTVETIAMFALLWDRILGRLFDLDAFDQPGVEESKEYARAMLGKAGKRYDRLRGEISKLSGQGGKDPAGREMADDRRSDP
ncbi:MAG: hypothetical protein GY856_54585 [bacterium]|nr:hypothetical protein [bacterium]